MIEILKMRASQTEEKMLTLSSRMDIQDNHMRIALKDVSTSMHEVSKFKERVETELKNHNEQSNVRF